MPSSHHNHPEPAERSDKLALTWTPKFPSQWHAQPAAWLPLIARCKEMQQTLAASDNDFTGPLLTGSAWNQLCNGAYRIPTTQRGIDSIHDNLRSLVSRAKDLLTKRAETGSTKLTLVERFVSRPEYVEVLNALEDAAENAGASLEERVVLLIGGTRCGKSAILAKLISENKVNWHLRAKPDMKGSYKRFLLGVGAALKLRDLDEQSQSRLQDSILNKLDKVTGVLAIEELQSFGHRALEFLKHLLNETRVSLVISMLPGQFRSMTSQSGEDMQQFLGRSVGIVQLTVSEKLVADFSPKLWHHCPRAKDLQKTIAQEANKGGGMSLVRDVCRDLGVLAGADGVQQHHVADALADFRRKMPAMTERRAA